MTILARLKPPASSGYLSGKSNAAKPTSEAAEHLQANSFSTAAASSSTPNGAARNFDMEPDHPFNLVPVAELVAEGFGQNVHDPIGHLAKQLGDAVLLDDIGRRCVTRTTAAALFAKRAAERTAQREAVHRKAAEQRAACEARREALKAERAREAEQAQGRPRTGNAFVDVVEYDPDRW
ncbi:hypothetical protein [Mycobacterium riyadhense]|uniref:hypothetical protein n=1 Tax=Mycobacterium riyadhense TaxID=486698 RepID=UPI00194DE519|nr:hypothetical protein [Mycobacterium riyadhense]